MCGTALDGGLVCDTSKAILLNDPELRVGKKLTEWRESISLGP